MTDTNRVAQYTEEAVGANHPSKSQVVDRHSGYFHDNAGRHKWRGGSNVASAASISIPDNENYFIVTGAVTIAGIAATTSGGSTVDTGVTIRLKFNSALTLTHNATSFIMPPGKSVTVLAGSFAEAIHLGSGNWAVLSVAVLVAGWTGAREGLVSINNATNPNYQVDITADTLTVTSTGGTRIDLTAVSQTVDITAVGVSGRDTSAAEMVSAWYEIYIIAKNDGTTASLLKLASLSGATTGVTANKLVASAALFVTNGVAVGDLVMNDTSGTTTTVSAIDSETQLALAADIFTGSPRNYRVFLNRLPVLPTDYTYKTFIGYRYNDSAGNFRKIIQLGNTIRFDEQVTDGSALTPSTTWTTVILSIPPKARQAFMTAFELAGDAANATSQWRTKGSAATTGHSITNIVTSGMREVNSFMALTDVYQRVEVNFNGATSSILYLYTDGYILSL